MLKHLFPTLGRFRFSVQIVMLFVTVYGGALLGSYAVDRISQALPSLSCAYDKMTGDHCILIVDQHQLHHRVGTALTRIQDVTFKVFVPTLMSVGIFFMFFFFLNKAFCGWVCPMGTVQELLYRIGRRLGRPLNRLNPNNVGKVRPVKWLMLLVLVLGLPLLAGMGVVPGEAGDPYCQVCPSRLLTTTADCRCRTDRSAHFYRCELFSWCRGQRAVRFCDHCRACCASAVLPYLPVAVVERDVPAPVADASGKEATRQMRKMRGLRASLSDGHPRDRQRVRQ